MGLRLLLQRPGQWGEGCSSRSSRVTIIHIDHNWTRTSSSRLRVFVDSRAKKSIQSQVRITHQMPRNGTFVVGGCRTKSSSTLPSHQTPVSPLQAKFSQILSPNTIDFTKSLLNLHITPPESTRIAPSKDQALADVRHVRAGNTHSAETAMIVWNMESYIRRVIMEKADEPAVFLLGPKGDKADIIKVLQVLRHRFRDVKTREGSYLKGNSDIDSGLIGFSLDSIRVAINASKHVRRGDLIWGTDLLSVGHSAKILRGLYMLNDGTSSLFRDKGYTALPRFPKFETYFLSRLFYARQNSMGAIDKQLMQSLKSKIEVIHQAPVPSIASVITLEMLPVLRWVDLVPIFMDMRKRLRDALEDFIEMFKNVAIFQHTQQIRHTASLRKLSEQLILDLCNVSTSKRTTSYLSIPPYAEERPILEELILTHHLLLQTRYCAQSSRASAHEVLSLVSSYVEILGAFGKRQHAWSIEGMRLFDIFIHLFTDHLRSVEPQAFSSNSDIVQGTLLTAPPGLVFLDVDFMNIDTTMTPPKFRFEVIGTWEASLRKQDPRRVYEHLMSRGGGLIAVEIPPSDPAAWRRITVIRSFPLRRFN
jgi:hypothetical protein